MRILERCALKIHIIFLIYISMNELNIYSIIGLYYELYEPDFQSLRLENMNYNDRWSLRRTNNLFWAKHFDFDRVKGLVSAFIDWYSYADIKRPQYSAIIQNPNYFIDIVTNAPKSIANQKLNKEDFFSILEYMTILCNMYSEIEYNPFKLSIEEGFVLNEHSSKELIENCLNPSKNPYYNFLSEFCFPVIEKSSADIIWHLGQFRYSTFAMAMFAKLKNPNIHISVVNHSSEYYSLNKIAKYLKQNKLLFSVIDSIVLDDTEHTQEKLLKNLQSQKGLFDIPNLMFVDKNSNEIIQTKYKQTDKQITNWYNKRPVSFKVNNEKIIDPSQIVNVKLWQNSHCHWNKCTFCGINKKYHTLTKAYEFTNIEEKVDLIAQLKKEGCDYFWLIDEAVPPQSLLLFGQELIKKNVNIIWQGRGKIETGFTLDVCKILAKSGLREIRLGLESASTRILNLMNKFPEDFNFDLIDEIVSNFFTYGVSVHFPIIIGFPTENEIERHETYQYLHRLNQKYDNFSFNINILGLDVSSKLFEKFDEYDITQISIPCSTKYFLGNIALWDCASEPINRLKLNAERNEFMRKTLYSFMPKTAMLPVNIFYRLSETSRATLIWKALKSKKAKQVFILDDIYQTTKNLAFTRLDDLKLHQVYNMDNHHIINCDQTGMTVLEYLRKPSNINDVLVKLSIKLTDTVIEQLKIAFTVGILKKRFYVDLGG